MCRLSWILGASTCWNSQGLFRCVMGLLFFRISFSAKVNLEFHFDNEYRSVSISQLLAFWRSATLITLWVRNWPASHFHTVLPTQPPIQRRKSRIIQWYLQLICHDYDRIITPTPSIHLHYLSVRHRNIFTVNLLFVTAYLHNALTWGVAVSYPLSFQYKGSGSRIGRF